MYGIAAVVIIFVVLGLSTKSFVRILSNWREFISDCIPIVISVMISSFISSRLLYMKNGLAKRWPVGILNFILSHVVVFIVLIVMYYPGNKTIYYKDAFKFVIASIALGGIFILPIFIILAYCAYPVKNK